MIDKKRYDSLFGFTLIELMFAIVFGVFIVQITTDIIANFFARNKKILDYNSYQIQLQVALNEINQSINLFGQFGCFNLKNYHHRTSYYSHKEYGHQTENCSQNKSHNYTNDYNQKPDHHDQINHDIDFEGVGIRAFLPSNPPVNVFTDQELLALNSEILMLQYGSRPFLVFSKHFDRSKNGVWYMFATAGKDKINTNQYQPKSTEFALASCSNITRISEQAIKIAQYGNNSYQLFLHNDQLFEHEPLDLLSIVEFNLEYYYIATYNKRHGLYKKKLLANGRFSQPVLIAGQIQKLKMSFLLIHNNKMSYQDTHEMHQNNYWNKIFSAKVTLM